MKLNIVLVEPEIPQNTGNIARTCAALGAKLHLVYPLGFSISEKQVKRAGLDYLDKLEIEEHLNFKSFLEKYKPEEHNMFFVTTKGKHVYSDPKFNEMDEVFALFGKEASLDNMYMHLFFIFAIHLIKSAAGHLCPGIL